MNTAIVSPLLSTVLLGAGEPPDSAMILQSRLSDSAVVAQKVLRSVTHEVTTADDKAAGLAGFSSKNESRSDLLLFFSHLNGKLAFRLWAEGGSEATRGTLWLDSASLEKKASGWRLHLRASGSGRLKLEPMWAPTERLTQLWASSTGLISERPAQVSALIASPMVLGMTPLSFPLSSKMQDFTLTLESDAPSLMLAMDRCYGALRTLCEDLRTEKGPFVWSQSKLSIDALTEASLEPSVGRERLSIRITPDAGEEIGTGTFDFAPFVKLRVALIDERGQLQGAMVMIGQA